MRVPVALLLALHLFHFRHSGGCVMIATQGFNAHFPDNSRS